MNKTEASFYPSWLSTKTLRQVIDHRADTTPDATYIIAENTGKGVTFGVLRQMTQKISARLAHMGIRPGESVAYAMTNGPQTVCFCLGVLYGGYRLTAINLVAGEKAIGYVLRHSDTCLAVWNGDNGVMLNRVKSEQDLSFAVAEVGEILNADQESTASLAEVGEEKDGLLMYTSGTTGVPKGVLLSQKNLIAGALNTVKAHELDRSDRALCSLPLYHINAFCVTMLGTLLSGGAAVFPPAFSTRSFWKSITEHSCTWFSLVPTQISYLLHADDQEAEFKRPKDLRFGRSASAPLAPQTKQLFEERFDLPIIETMGLTETAAQILSNPLPPKKRKAGSPGYAFGNRVFIGDAEQNPLPPGEQGEIIVIGENVMKGYYKNPEATRQALNSKGFLRTGDLGTMDEDEYVFVTGRLKELIIKGGENISPREIDETLYRYPGVVEAAAFACPCENYGQRIEACVSLADQAQADEQALLLHCQKELGSFKTPDSIHFLDQLPKGPSGKIQRLKLRETVYPAAR